MGFTTHHFNNSDLNASILVSTTFPRDVSNIHYLPSKVDERLHRTGFNKIPTTKSLSYYKDNRYLFKGGCCY